MSTDRLMGPSVDTGTDPVVDVAERYAAAYVAAQQITRKALGSSYGAAEVQNVHFAALEAMQLAVGWERGR
jgi:hypothetical protein